MFARRGSHIWGGGGSLKDFETLYRLYFPDVFRYVCRLSGDSVLAEEITAETFFRALTAVKDFRGDCDIRIWLCQIAKNIYFSGRKERSRTVPLPAEELPAEIPDAEEFLAEKSDASLIRRLVHELDEPYKEVFMLRVFMETDFKTIGGLFGRSANWACVIYHRAKKKIIERIEAIGKGDETK